MSNESRNFCQGLTKDDKPCRARPMPGGLCYFHANPDQARILGQKGGRGNRYPVMDVVVPDDVTVDALGTLLDQAMEALLAGRMNPRVASAVALLVNTKVRLIETVELTARVASSERKLAAPRTAAAAEASVAVEEPAFPLWWMRPKNGDGGGGDGSGHNSEA